MLAWAQQPKSRPCLVSRSEVSSALELCLTTGHLLHSLLEPLQFFQIAMSDLPLRRIVKASDVKETFRHR